MPGFVGFSRLGRVLGTALSSVFVAYDSCHWLVRLGLDRTWGL